MHRIYILDPGLQGVGGHYLEYAKALVRGATGQHVQCIIACHKGAATLQISGAIVRPTYSSGVWSKQEGKKYNSADNIKFVSHQFADETRQLLSHYPLQDGDSIFIPNIAAAHILVPALLAEEYANEHVNFTFMFRYPSSFYRTSITKGSFARLEANPRACKINLCTDSHRLARELSILTPLPFAVLPIPHTDQTQVSGMEKSATEKVLHIISLGNARGEKGILEISQAIQLSAQRIWSHKVRFTIQINDPYDDHGAVAHLRSSLDPRVTLIDKPLDSEDYNKLLQESDIVLTPYHRSAYRERTSGVFLEALIAGKSVICTSDTWMSDLLKRHNCGLAISDQSPLLLTDAIEKLVASFEIYSRRAYEAASYWKKIHNPENLIKHLIPDFRRKEPESSTRRKAAVIFPWSDAVEGTSGASRRLHLLVGFLETHYAEVRIIFTANSEKTETAGWVASRTFAQPYYYRNIKARFLELLTKLCTFVVSPKKGLWFHLYFHLWPRLDMRFKELCNNTTEWADDIYVEYSYFVPVIRNLLKTSGLRRKLIVTQHDILSNQSLGAPVIHWITRKLEFSALRMADSVVSVSAEDQKVLNQASIPSKLIPYGITARNLSGHVNELPAILKQLVRKKKICLFVGANHKPNNQAAQRILEFANVTKSQQEKENIFYIVVGDCMTPRETENFIALGRVESYQLEALYSLCDLILVPIEQGTGVSIKFIEALVQGKPILTTSVGMRGSAAEHRKHAFIENDISKFPTRISEILSDTKLQKFLARNGRQLALNYDFEKLFAQYLEDV